VRRYRHEIPRNITERQNRIRYARGLKQSIRAMKKGAIVVKDKTGHITRESVRQLAALEKKSKESIKRIFKKEA
jgi:hypothetical protein